MASAIYNLEPLTKGKVVLHTTLGDIEVELWPKEAPKARSRLVPAPRHASGDPLPVPPRASAPRCRTRPTRTSPASHTPAT